MVDMIPTEFSPISVDSWQECASTCKHQKNCNHWQFVPYDNECSFAISFHHFQPSKLNVTAGERTCPNTHYNIFTLCPTGDDVSSMWKNVGRNDNFYDPKTMVKVGE